ncbi:MAG: glycosyltransferase, partial [Acidobacteriota bacterium]
SSGRKKMAKVDVLIPFYNTPIRFTRECLESLLRQTFTDWRAIIINDGSSADSTRALEQLLAEYGDARLSYIATPNRGSAAARNAGIAHGSAPLIALLDSDDEWIADKLERQVAMLDENDEIGLVHTACVIVDEHGEEQGRSEPSRDANQLSASAAFERMLYRNFVTASSVVFRRQLGARVGYFDEAFICIQDKELWLRLIADGGRFHMIPEPLVRYREHGDNISKKVERLLGCRAALIDKMQRVVANTPWLSELNWPRVKRGMQRRMHQEAAEGYLSQGRIGKVIWHAIPLRCGFTRISALLMARAVYRWLFPRRTVSPARPSPDYS